MKLWGRKLLLIGVFLLCVQTMVFALQDGLYTYELDSEGKAVITDYDGVSDGDKPNLIIPTTLMDVATTSSAATVVAIGKDAFRGDDCKFVTVAIPDTVLVIEESAFRECEMTSVKLPSGLKILGKYSFEKNNLVEIDLPDGLEEIGNWAFGNNDILELIIPETVKSIESKMIYKNPTKKIVIKGDFEAIGNFGPFFGDSYSNTLLNKVDLGFKLRKIPRYGFVSGQLTSVLLPESVIEIEENAFEKNQLEEIEFPSKLEKIGKEAFMKNKISELTLPDSVTEIDGSAFYHNKIETLSLPDKLTKIEGLAFRDNLISVVNIPESVTYIGPEAFFDNKMTSFMLPPSKPGYITSWKSGDKTFKAGEEVSDLTLEYSGTRQEIHLTGQPLIIGQAIYDEVLSVDKSGLKNDTFGTGDETPTVGSYHYKWLRNDIEIEEATESSYRLTKGDIGHRIQVSVSSAVEFGSVESDQTSVVLKATTTNAPRVTLKELTSFSATLGEETGVEYAISDGSLPLSALSWQDSPVFTGLSEANSYVCYGRRKETETHLSSEVSDPLAIKTKRNLRGSVGLNGEAEYEALLSVDVSGVVNNTGDLTYQWYRGDQVIAGASESTYRVVGQDVGQFIKVAVSSSVEYGTIEAVMTRVISKLSCPHEKGRVAVLSNYDYSSITLVSVEGYEYMLITVGEDVSKGLWQDEVLFADLVQNTNYIAYQRVKETEGYYASDISDYLKVKTPNRPSNGSSSSGKSSSNTREKVSNEPAREKKLEQEIKVTPTLKKDETGSLVLSQKLRDGQVIKELNALLEKGIVLVDMTNEDGGRGQALGIEVSFSQNILTQMKKKSASMEIKSQVGHYLLPMKSIDDKKVYRKFGPQVDLSKVSYHIEISPSSLVVTNNVDRLIDETNARLLVAPVSFNVEARYEGQRLVLDEMTQFVSRSLPLPKEGKLIGTVTGLAIERDGSLRPVPTRIIELDGTLFAQMNSVTNSLYGVIENEVKVDKIVGHWAEKEILEAVSGLIIREDLIPLYNPNDPINRGEFTKLFAKTIGLQQVDGTSFSDLGSVENKGYIYAAHKYHLISCKSQGVFGPSENLTREQAVTILYNVLNMTDYEKSKISDHLMFYADGASVAPSAKEAMNWVIGKKIMTGKTLNELAPKESITCAQAIVLIDRLLEVIELK